MLVFLVACSGSSQVATPPATPVAPEPPSEPRADPVVPPAPPPTPTANAEPDRAPAGNDDLVNKVAGFVDAFVNSEPIFTRDGKRVVFVSNRHGLPQIYVADASKPTSPATRLVEWPQRMGSIQLTPDGTSVVFMSDEGADELWAFYRVDLDGKNLVALTPGEKLNRNPPMIPDGAPDTMFFSARKMSEATTTVYAASAVTPGPVRAIYSDPMPLVLSDVSPDGKQALAIRFPRRPENYVLVIDTATGQARQLYPAQGEVSIFDVDFSPDAKTVYVTTDGGAEQGLVLALDVKTGKERARYVETRPASALLSSVDVAKHGGLLAVNVVAGEHGELRLLDAKTLKPRRAVTMPLGTGGSNEFSEDGRTLTVAWSTPQKPFDLHAMDTATGKIRPLRDEPRLSVTPPAIDVSVVQIDAFDGGKIPINVYRPAGGATTPRPVIVSYHGGPSGVSQIRWNAGIAFFVSLGYAWVEPNVRGSSGFGRAFEAADDGAKRLDAFKDIESSARWAAAQPWADKDRMIVFGGSYGGYTVLVALSRWPDIWRAGVDLFGIVNLATFMSTTSGLIRQLFLTEFGDPDKDAKFLAEISPWTDVDKIVDPTFVYAGANDSRVPRSESDLIVKALRQRSIPVEYMVSADEGHSLARRPNQIELYARVARFLQKHTGR